MSPTPSVTVVVCNDRPILREGLERLLDAERDIDVLGGTDNATQAIMLLRQAKPQVLVTGMSLGDVGGTKLISRLIRESPQPPPRLLVYATIEDDEVLGDVLRCGASGVLSDDATREEMVLAVRTVARGQAMFGPGIADRMLAWFRRQRSHPEVNQLEPVSRTLTPREKEILVLTALGLSIDDIARQLFIGVATVRSHIYRVRCKLQLRDRAQLVSFAYRAGLVQRS